MTTEELLHQGTRKFGEGFAEVAQWIAEKLCNEFGFDAIDMLEELRDL